MKCIFYCISIVFLSLFTSFVKFDVLCLFMSVCLMYDVLAQTDGLARPCLAGGHSLIYACFMVDM